MRYKDLEGAMVDGEVWSSGESHGTVFVLRPDGTAALVHEAKRIEIEYTPTEYKPPIPQALEELARSVVDAYKESCRTFAALGVKPHHPDYEWALGVLRSAEDARKSRLPFINAHPLRTEHTYRDSAGKKVTRRCENYVQINQSVGDGRYFEASTVTVYVDGAAVEVPYAEYRKLLKDRGKPNV